jgi:hypothetical protein
LSIWLLIYLIEMRAQIENGDFDGNPIASGQSQPPDAQQGAGWD